MKSTMNTSTAPSPTSSRQVWHSPRRLALYWRLAPAATCCALAVLLTRAASVASSSLPRCLWRQQQQ